MRWRTVRRQRERIELESKLLGNTITREKCWGFDIQFFVVKKATSVLTTESAHVNICFKQSIRVIYLSLLRVSTPCIFYAFMQTQSSSNLLRIKLFPCLSNDLLQVQQLLHPPQLFWIIPQCELEIVDLQFMPWRRKSCSLETLFPLVAHLQGGSGTISLMYSVTMSSRTATDSGEGFGSSP